MSTWLGEQIYWFWWNCCGEVLFHLKQEASPMEFRFLMNCHMCGLYSSTMDAIENIPMQICIIQHYTCVLLCFYVSTDLLMLGLFLEGILALPLAAGLSWEICFEGGLTELSEELGHRGTTSLACAVTFPPLDSEIKWTYSNHTYAAHFPKDSQLHLEVHPGS